MVGEGGFESLALGLAEREVSFPPHDQCGPVGEGGQAGFDLAGGLGCGDELAGGGGGRCGAGWGRGGRYGYGTSRVTGGGRPRGKKNLGTKLTPRVRVLPIGPPISQLNARTRGSRSSGQAHVLPMISRVISSGRRAAKPRPMGAPQSWTMSVMLVGPSSPTRRSSSWLCSRGRELKARAAHDMP